MSRADLFVRVERGSRQLPRRLSRAGVCAGICAALVTLSACSDTHAGADVDGGSGQCATCHMPAYLGARRHAGVKPTTCGVCHTQGAWTPHVKRHGWPLTGAHAEVECFKCHTGATPKYEDTASECVACHLDTFERETFAEHLGYSRECARCHTTTAWLPATWNGRAIDPAEHAARVSGRAWTPPVVAPVEAPDAGVPPDAGAHRRPRVVAPRRPRPVPPPGVDPVTGGLPEPVTPEPVTPDLITPPPRPTPVTPDVTTSASRRR